MLIVEVFFTKVKVHFWQFTLSSFYTDVMLACLCLSKNSHTRSLDHIFLCCNLVNGSGLGWDHTSFLTHNMGWLGTRTVMMESCDSWPVSFLQPLHETFAPHAVPCQPSVWHFHLFIILTDLEFQSTLCGDWWRWSDVTDEGKYHLMMMDLFYDGGPRFSIQCFGDVRWLVFLSLKAMAMTTGRRSLFFTLFCLLVS